MGSQSSGKCCRVRAAIPPGAAAKEHLCPLCVVVPDVPCLCRPALRAAWQVQRGQPVQPAARGVLHRHPGAAALRLQVRLLPSPPRAAFSLPSTSCGLEYLASPKGLFWGEILLCFTEIKHSQLPAPLHNPELPGEFLWLCFGPVPCTQTALLSNKHWFNW